MDVAVVVVAGIALILSMLAFFSKHRPFVLVDDVNIDKDDQPGLSFVLQNTGEVLARSVSVSIVLAGGDEFDPVETDVGDLIPHRPAEFLTDYFTKAEGDRVYGTGSSALFDGDHWLVFNIYYSRSWIPRQITWHRLRHRTQQPVALLPTAGIRTPLNKQSHIT